MREHSVQYPIADPGHKPSMRDELACKAIRCVGQMTHILFGFLVVIIISISGDE